MLEIKWFSGLQLLLKTTKHIRKSLPEHFAINLKNYLEKS
jgi:hypothetical protein